MHRPQEPVVTATLHLTKVKGAQPVRVNLLGDVLSVAADVHRHVVSGGHRAGLKVSLVHEVGQIERRVARRQILGEPLKEVIGNN